VRLILFAILIIFITQIVLITQSSFYVNLLIIFLIHYRWVPIITIIVICNEYFISTTLSHRDGRVSKWFSRVNNSYDDCRIKVKASRILGPCSCPYSDWYCVQRSLYNIRIVSKGYSKTGLNVSLLIFMLVYSCLVTNVEKLGGVYVIPSQQSCTRMLNLSSIRLGRVEF